MAHVIKCPECGYVSPGETDEILIENTRYHIEGAHPELADKLSDKELRDMIVEAEDDRPH